MKFVFKLKDLLAYSSVVNLLIMQERPLFKVGKPKLGRNHRTAVIHHNLCNVSMSIFDCHFLLSRFCLTLANVQVWIRHGHRNSICYQTHWFFFSVIILKLIAYLSWHVLQYQLTGDSFTGVPYKIRLRDWYQVFARVACYGDSERR